MAEKTEEGCPGRSNEEGNYQAMNEILVKSKIIVEGIQQFNKIMKLGRSLDIIKILRR